MLFSKHQNRFFYIAIGISTQLLLSPVAGAFTLQGTDPGVKGWDRSNLKVKVNYTDCTVSKEALNQAIDSAFTLWNSVSTSGLKLVRGEETTASLTDYYNQTASSIDNGPAIFCSATFSNVTSQNSNSIIGLGYSSSNSGQITFGFLVLNSESGKNAEISKVSSTLLSIVVAHEIGHVLGLGHSQESSALMYYDLSAKTKLALSKDDTAGITYLYPRNEIASPYPLGCGTTDRHDKNSKGRGPGGPESAIANLLLIFSFAFLASRRYPRPSIP